MIKQDKEGRQITLPYEVRGADVTGNASLTTGTPTILVSPDSDYFLDLVQLSFANSSDAAITITLENDGTTLRTFHIPANTTQDFSYAIPVRQNNKAVGWRADMGDFTNTSVVVDAQFIKNK